MADQDIRWRQRLANFHKALAQLTQAIELGHARTLSDLERQGLIKSFEFTFELAWNVMKDYFDYQGASLVTGSRDAIREAFARNLVADGEGWMAMIQDRNRTSHTYNEGVAREIAERVNDLYHPLFAAFAARMDELAGKTHA